MTHEDTYNHVLPAFAEEVYKSFDKQDILDYYPYGKETEWNYWLCGKVDLRKVYKEKRNEKKTPKDLVLGILDETARAMNYLMVHGNYQVFDRQRIEAFTLYRLFHRGIVDWTKKPLKGLSEKEKDELYKLHEKRYDLVMNDINHRSEKQTRRLMKNKPEELAKYDDLCVKAKIANRKKYGILFVKHMPLMQYGNCADIPKILYTKQQLCAIDLMVTCAFENLC
jgi:hypothetical protein